MVSNTSTLTENATNGFSLTYSTYLWSRMSLGAKVPKSNVSSTLCSREAERPLVFSKREKAPFFWTLHVPGTVTHNCSVRKAFSPPHFTLGSLASKRQRLSWLETVVCPVPKPRHCPPGRTALATLQRSVRLARAFILPRAAPCHTVGISAAPKALLECSSL